MNAARRLLAWYGRGLKSAPVFTAGYVVGGVVVGVMTQVPALATAAVRLVP